LCRNCLLKHIIDEKIETKLLLIGRRERRRKQLLDDLKKTGICKSKEEELDSTLQRTRFGRGYGPVVRYYRMNDGI